MTDLPIAVTDEMVGMLRERLGDAGLVGLTYMIALENMRARTYQALGITAQGYNQRRRLPAPI